MEQRNQPHSPLGILFLILFIAAAAFSAWLISTALEAKKTKILKTINYLKSEYDFAELKINFRDGQKVGFTLTLLDNDGDSIAKKDFVLQGSDIFLESKVVVIDFEEKERAFIFPTKVYTDKIPPKEGFDLLSLYSENNIPKNYFTKNPDADFVSAIKEIYSVAFSGEESKNQLDEKSIKVVLNMDAVLHQNPFQGFQEGKSYKCIAHPNGGLELMEVK